MCTRTESETDLIAHARSLAPAELLRELHQRICHEHAALVWVVVLLAEMDERRAFAKESCPSLFDYCRQHLKLSEGASARRINVARAIRAFPELLPLFQTREVSLTNLSLISKRLTKENCVALAREVGNCGRIEVERILAKRFPQPDVRSSIRMISPPVVPPRATPPAAHAPPSTTPPVAVMQTTSPPNPASATPVAPNLPFATPPVAVMPTNSPPPPAPPSSFFVPEGAPQSCVRPLAENRYLVRFMIDEETSQRLEHAKRMTRHSNPRGDLEPLMKRAIELLHRELERERLGKTDRPQNKKRPRRDPRDISRAAKRAVIERDAEQCTYRDDAGNRCPARERLEIDHIVPRARGGAGTADNIRLRCRAHNRLAAEEIFGRTHVAKKIAERRAARVGDRTRSPPPTESRVASPTRMGG